MKSRYQIYLNYYRKVFRLLGHRAPRRFAQRQVGKFLKILTPVSVSKIEKRLKLGYFEGLDERDRIHILGEHVVRYDIPELAALGYSIEDYLKYTSNSQVGFTPPENPKFTVIIPVYEQYELTLSCLKSLSFLYARRTDLEVILADDSKVTNYEIALRKSKVVNVMVYPNETPEKGFLTNCNQASEKAKGEYIIFLNNDTIVLPGWLEGLEKHLACEGVKIVGSKLIYPDGILQEAGGAIFNDGNAANIGRLKPNDHPYYNFSRESDYISGASLCVERRWFMNSGMFDPLYIPAYYEDTDLCVRAKKSGYKVMYAAESQVIHFEGKSCGVDVTDGSSIKKFQVINKEKFLGKWDLSIYSKPVSPDEHYRLVHKRETILVICPYPVRLDKDSGCKRMFYLVSILQENYDVVLYASPEENRTNRSDVWVRTLNKMGVEVVTSHTNIDFRGLMEQRQFEKVWISWLESAKLFYRSVDDFSKYEIIYDTVDIHFIREGRKLNVDIDNLETLAQSTCFNEELAVIQQAKEVIVVSSFEKQFLLDKFDVASTIVGNIEGSIEPCNIPFERKENTIAFVGSFLHEPNVSSIRNFLQHYWAPILMLLPDVQLKIIGNRSDDYCAELEEYRNVKVLGWVESVEEHIADCKMTIAPLTHGAGVKGKINQSLACGIPVLASPVAAEGMIKSSGEPCGIIVAGIDEFPQKMAALLSANDSLINESLAGVEWVNEICGYSIAQESVNELLSRF